MNRTMANKLRILKEKTSIEVPREFFNEMMNGIHAGRRYVNDKEVDAELTELLDKCYKLQKGEKIL